jgi:hypothetical protein
MPWNPPRIMVFFSFMRYAHSIFGALLLAFAFGRAALYFLLLIVLSLAERQNDEPMVGLLGNTNS